jgi:predicted DNA-binding ribbon-helix-helix protein
MANDANTRGTDRQIKNLFVNGRRTSLRLEMAFWDGFETCARNQGKSIHQLANSALQDYAMFTSSLSSAVRLLIIDHFREQALAAVNGNQAEREREARSGGRDPNEAIMARGEGFLKALRDLTPSATSSPALRHLLGEIKVSVDRLI